MVMGVQWHYCMPTPSTAELGLWPWIDWAERNKDQEEHNLYKDRTMPAMDEDLIADLQKMKADQQIIHHGCVLKLQNERRQQSKKLARSKAKSCLKPVNNGLRCKAKPCPKPISESNPHSAVETLCKSQLQQANQALLMWV